MADRDGQGREALAHECGHPIESPHIDGLTCRRPHGHRGEHDHIRYATEWPGGSR